MALYNKRITDIVYIDFQKAFNSVSHKKLLTKLEGYGISGDLLAWLTAFLSNRTQVVNANGSLSDVGHITSGVPQGLRSDTDSIFFDTSVRIKLFASVCDELKRRDDKWQMRIAFNKCSVHRISNSDSRHCCRPYCW